MTALLLGTTATFFTNLSSCIYSLNVLALLIRREKEEEPEYISVDFDYPSPIVFIYI